MEIDFSPPSRDSAAARLQGYAEVRARVDQRGPSRAVALLLLWDALAMAAFMGAVLFSSGGGRFEDVATDTAIYPLWLMVLPIVVLRSLVRGAQEAFSIRKKPSPGYWIAYAVITSACLALLLTDVTYPWWVNILAPAVLFMAMAVGPIQQFRSSPASRSELRTNEPLGHSTRWTTVLIGVAMGLLVVIGTQSLFPTLSSAVIFLLIIGALFSRRLPLAGAEWRSTHSAAFGIVTILLFVLFVLLSNTNWVTAPISLVAGALALLIMLLVAFLPIASSEG